MINEIREILASLGYFYFKELSSTRLAVLVDDSKKSRDILLHEIWTDFPFSSKLHTDPSPISSVGYIQYKDIQICVKPIDKQGNNSPGIKNEKTFYELIHKKLRLSGEIDVRFFSEEKSFVLKNIRKIVDTSHDTKQHTKADIILLDKYNNSYPISLKMSNAEMWESADTFFRNEAIDMMASAKSQGVSTIEDSGIYKISNNIARRVPDSLAHHFVFGSDILSQKGAIIISTFRNNINMIFDSKENCFNIICDYIMTEPADIKDNREVYLLIRNDRSRRTKGFWPGIRYLAVFKSRITDNVKLV